MQAAKYKFVKYDTGFPVYFSRQSGKKNLVFPHYHEDIEILKVTGGAVRVQAGSEQLECYRGDILVFFPNTLHQMISVGENAAVAALVYRPQHPYLSGEFAPKSRGFYAFGREHPCRGKLSALFDAAAELYAQRDDAYEMEMTACLLQLSAVFVREKILLQTGKPAEESRLQPAFEYIERNIGTAIKITELAELLNFSKEHVIRLFKSETGKSPAEYIADVKLKKAIEMLREGRFSMTGISEKLGFANPSHFSKMFKDRLRMTPTEYRRSAAAGNARK